MKINFLLYHELLVAILVDREYITTKVKIKVAKNFYLNWYLFSLYS